MFLYLIRYFQSIIYYSNDNNYNKGLFFTDPQIRCNLYAIGKMFYLWHKPHYRNINFQQDLKQNLSDVVLPYTCIPLSFFCYSRYLMYIFVFIIYPTICFFTSFSINLEKWNNNFYNYLFKPDNWFIYWRLNCLLVSLHSYKTKSTDYKLEDKWAFTELAKKKNISVCDYLEIEKLFVKHRNKEGGMGCHIFKNAISNGDWLIQKVYKNSKFITNLIGDDAPLSTFRIVTKNNRYMSNQPDKCDINTLTCVFRAGLPNAKTDHNSILFNIEKDTGKFVYGKDNSKWYKVSLDLFKNEKNHNNLISKFNNISVKNFDRITNLAETAHKKLVPNIPIAGWDIAMVSEDINYKDGDIFLLEGNFSCNLYNGIFSKIEYYSFLENEFLNL